MKRVYIGVLLSILLSACSNHINEAIEYNEKIVLSYDKIANLEERLMFLLITEDTAYYDTELEKFRIQIEKSDSLISDLGPFRGYSDFYDAAKQMMEGYRIVDKKIECLMQFVKNKSTLDAENLENYEAVFEADLFEIDSILEHRFEFFDLSQQRFAAKFSFRLM